MYNLRHSKPEPLKVGYYKFNALQGALAEVEYKPLLLSDSKIVCTVDITALFDTRSERPRVYTLYRKLIRIDVIYPDDKGQIKYCNWSLITLKQFEFLKAKEDAMKVPTRVDLTNLTAEEALSFYDKIKANPENVLPDALEEQCSFDDFNSDDYDQDDNGGDDETRDLNNPEDFNA